MVKRSGVEYTVLYYAPPHSTAPSSNCSALLCAVLLYLFPPARVLFCIASCCTTSSLPPSYHISLHLFLHLFTAGPEAIHGGIGNSNGTGNVFDISTLRMSRSDYHMSDEEASVGTQRDFLWGVIMGYFLGMYVHIRSAFQVHVYILCFVGLG